MFAIMYLHDYYDQNFVMARCLWNDEAKPAISELGKFIISHKYDQNFNPHCLKNINYGTFFLLLSSTMTKKSL